MLHLFSKTSISSYFIHGPVTFDMAFHAHRVLRKRTAFCTTPSPLHPAKKMHDRVIHVIHCCTALIFRKAKPAGVEQLSHTVTVFHLVRPLSPPPVTLHKEIIFHRWKFHGLAVTESWKHYRFYRLVVCKTENNGKHKVIIIAV